MEVLSRSNRHAHYICKVLGEAKFTIASNEVQRASRGTKRGSNRTVRLCTWSHVYCVTLFSRISLRYGWWGTYGSWTPPWMDACDLVSMIPFLLAHSPARSVLFFVSVCHMAAGVHCPARPSRADDSWSQGGQHAPQQGAC